MSQVCSQMFSCPFAENIMTKMVMLMKRVQYLTNEFQFTVLESVGTVIVPGQSRVNFAKKRDSRSRNDQAIFGSRE